MFEDREIVILDTEYTSWEGCVDEGWDNDAGEYREVVQIAAVRVDTEYLEEISSFDQFVRPQINPELSDYFVDLTGISQDEVDGADQFTAVAQRFVEWVGDRKVYSYGNDYDVLARNVELYDAEVDITERQYRDVRDVLENHGVPTGEYTSGTVAKHFSAAPEDSRVHNALYDCRSVLTALQHARSQSEG